MRTAIDRRVWQTCLAGFIALSAVWWWQQRGLVAPPTDMAMLSATGGPAAQLIARLPLAFQPNLGQSDGQVLFLSRNSGYSLFLTAQEAVISLRGAAQALRISWQGANPKPEVAGFAELPGKYHYLRGNDPARWQRDIPSYQKVRYRELYPGIDLIYYGQLQQLEYDLVVAPGADPAPIRLHLTGMSAVNLDEKGALRLQVAGRSLSLSKPTIYQETAAGKRLVDGAYVLLADNQVGLRLASYDSTRPLIIDPVLSYSTYLGGGGTDQGTAVAADSGGNIYMVGQTTSVDFPVVTPGTYQPEYGGGDADVFVAKYSPSGSTLLYATYLGGNGMDRGFGIAVDVAHNAYIVGDTDSADFPVQAAAQSTRGGGIDAFVAKLNPDGASLAYSTYLGGRASEEGRGIAIDGSGSAYVAGGTLSDDFPASSGAAHKTIAGTADINGVYKADAFVAKYDTSGALVYATYLGGTDLDAANAITVDSANQAYVTGVTYSQLLATTSNVQSGLSSLGDAFVARLNDSGSTVSYFTYLGGTGWDQGQAIALDSGGNIYVAGATNSTSVIPTKLPRRSNGGGTDAFVAKLNAAGDTLQYFTYLGGSKQDIAFDLAVDSSGNAVVVGETMSTDFPVDTPVQYTWFGGGKNQWGDAFVAKLDQNGFIGWSTFLGGGDDDWANSVALSNSSIYVSGTTFSSDFPTADPQQPGAAGDSDALLFKLDDVPFSADLAVSASGSPDPVGSGETLTYQVDVTNINGPNDASGVVVVSTLPGGVSLKTAPGNCTGSGAQVTCDIGNIAVGGSASITLATVSNTAGDITFNAKIARARQPDPDTGNNSASVTTKAAVGNSGGGAWSVLELLLSMVIYFLGRKREIISR